MEYPLASRKNTTKPTKYVARTTNKVVIQTKQVFTVQKFIHLENLQEINSYSDIQGGIS